MPAWKVGHFQNSKSPLLTLQRSPTSSFPLSVALSHSAALFVSSSPASSFVLVFSLLLSNSPFSFSHCRSQPLRSRALTLAFFTVSLSSEKVSLCCEGLRTVQVSALCVLAKGWFFISFMFEKHVKVAVLSAVSYTHLTLPTKRIV